uniref:Uncharacterized protein n=1 Tax=Arundo donax TaxID=35708 RepID=A0A0A9AGU1_ARUDO
MPWLRSLLHLAGESAF